MPANFIIGIPTINRADLLNPSLTKYANDFPGTKVFIVDNGNQEIYIPDGAQGRMYIERPGRNIGVAASWNMMISNIFENPANEYAVIINDDVYLGWVHSYLESVIKEVQSKVIEDEDMENVGGGFIILPLDNKYDWCVFVISRQAWDTIGEFDEQFYPAYFEDRDYEYRAKLTKTKIYRCLMPPQQFLFSSSIKRDEELLPVSRANRNRDYYVAKWGGEPGKETYKTAFNL